MPRNQTNTQSGGTGAGTARAKSRSRTTASKHSKPLAAEAATVMVIETPHQDIEEIVASWTEAPVARVVPQENPLQAISKMAYIFWEERGGVGGDPLADWVRAEEEYRRRLASA
jgi:hypothetical protein